MSKLTTFLYRIVAHFATVKIDKNTIGEVDTDILITFLGRGNKIYVKDELNKRDLSERQKKRLLYIIKKIHKEERSPNILLIHSLIYILSLVIPTCILCLVDYMHEILYYGLLIMVPLILLILYGYFLYEHCITFDKLKYTYNSLKKAWFIIIMVISNLSFVYINIFVVPKITYITENVRESDRREAVEYIQEMMEEVKVEVEVKMKEIKNG